MGAYALVNGQYEVQILRLAAKQVRLKISSLRVMGGGVSVGGDFSDVQITGASLIDDQILQAVNPNIVSAYVQKTMNKSFVMDYVLDLGQTDVADAFNATMSQLRSYNFTAIANPQKTNGAVRRELIADVNAIEELREADLKKGQTNRIFRKSQTVTESFPLEVGVQLGNSIAGLKVEHRDSTSKMEVLDNAGNTKNYDFAMVQDKSEFNFFFRLLQWNEKDTKASIKQDNEAMAYAMTSEQSSKTFSAHEAQKIEKRLSQMLPQLRDQLKVPELAKGSELNNVVTRTLMVIEKEAFKIFPSMNDSQVAAAYWNYLKQNNMTDIVLPTGSYVRSAPSTQQRLQQAIRLDSAKLAKVLDKGISDSEKMKGLDQLYNSLLFRMTGPGFLMSLLPQSEVQNLIRIEVTISSTGTSKSSILKFAQGPVGPKNLYSQLLLNENFTNGHRLDLRLESETVTEDVLRAKTK